MRDIKINNQEVLDALNNYKDWLYPKWLSGDMDRDLKIKGFQNLCVFMQVQCLIQR